MNWNERENIKDRLRCHIAAFLRDNGETVFDKEKSNPYVCMRITEVIFKGNKYQIQDVDGLTCLIKKEAM